jgi:hypothetical protein
MFSEARVGFGEDNVRDVAPEWRPDGGAARAHGRQPYATDRDPREQPITAG